MSEARDLLQNIVTERQVWSADSVTNLTTGRPFDAEIEPVTSIELNTELGRDARESVLVHVLNQASADDIQLNTLLRVTLFGKAITLKVLRREQNPSNVQVEFGCMKVTTLDT